MSTSNTESKTLIFSFDGTSSEPRDTHQYSTDHFKEDSEISNVLKLHLMLGGKLHNQSPCTVEHQHCFYYSGIGNQGSPVKKLLNQILAPSNNEVATILSNAINEFNHHYNQGDILLIIGFSRGAALARRFAKCLEQFISHNVYLCVFDTIASIGFNKVAKATCGTEHVIFADHDVASNVKQVLHCVSLDDKRRAFEPTLFNYAPHIKEVWFAGCHSDVGGGFYRSGLSDITLQYALNWLISLNLNLQFLNKAQINFTSLLPHDGPPLIDEDDLTLSPDPLAHSHQHEYFWSNCSFKPVNRVCAVMEKNDVSTRLPIIHHSVAKRIYNDPSYRPESLKSLNYSIENSHTSNLTCKGLSPLITLPNQHITILRVGEKIKIKIYASELYNQTGVMLEKGATFRFSLDSNNQWYDKGTPVTSKGWSRNGQSIGVKSLSIELLSPYKRAISAPWFALIGCINAQDDTAFILTDTCDVRINRSGEFTPFANDIMQDYNQNLGFIELTVTRLG